jgi:hypothetical protein
MQVKRRVILMMHAKGRKSQMQELFHGWIEYDYIYPISYYFHIF